MESSVRNLSDLHSLVHVRTQDFSVSQRAALCEFIVYSALKVVVPTLMLPEVSSSEYLAWLARLSRLVYLKRRLACESNLGSERSVIQILRGSFSAVSKLIFETKYSLEYVGMVNLHWRGELLTRYIRFTSFCTSPIACLSTSDLNMLYLGIGNHRNS